MKASSSFSNALHPTQDVSQDGVTSRLFSNPRVQKNANKQLPLGARDWIPLIRHCKPQSSQNRSPRVKDATHTITNMPPWRRVSYCGPRNHDMGLFRFNQRNKRRTWKHEPPPRSGFPSDEKLQCGAATLNCLYISFLNGRMIHVVAFCLVIPHLLKRKRSLNRLPRSLLRLFASSLPHVFSSLGRFSWLRPQWLINMTQAQDYPKAKPVLSSSLRKGVNESQHHVLHKISSSQVTKSSNIWPINTIPQPSRTPRQTHAQKLVKTDTADARKDTHCVHVQATCELIPLRSSSEGGNRWFRKNLPFV